jgi:putative membrane protein
MFTLLKNWAILSAAVFVTSMLLLPVMKLKSWKTAIWVAALFGLLQALLMGVLTFLTLPLWLLTFGLFTFVLQAVLLWVTDRLVDDMRIKSFGWTLVAAVLISLLDRFGHWLFG